MFPKDRDRFALRVVIDAGGVHQRRLAEPRCFFDGFNQPAALSEMNKLPWLGQWEGGIQSIAIGSGRGNER